MLKASEMALKTITFGHVIEFFYILSTLILLLKSSTQISIILVNMAKLAITVIMCIYVKPGPYYP